MFNSEYEDYGDEGGIIVFEEVVNGVFIQIKDPLDEMSSEYYTARDELMKMAKKLDGVKSIYLSDSMSEVEGATISTTGTKYLEPENIRDGGEVEIFGEKYNIIYGTFNKYFDYTLFTYENGQKEKVSLFIIKRVKRG